VLDMKALFQKGKNGIKILTGGGQEFIIPT
jgi:hypothetical protein